MIRNFVMMVTIKSILPGKNTCQHSTVTNYKAPHMELLLTILPAQATELDLFFMMMNTYIFQHIVDDTTYVCRGENQKKT